MRVRTVATSLLGVAIVATIAISVWVLREPLQESVIALRNKAGGGGEIVRFAVVGDNHGDNPVYRQILDDLKTEPLDFMVNLADTSEYGTREEFMKMKELEAAVPFPVYHTVGNHDIKSDPTRGLFTEVFGTPAWYSFDRDSVHFVILDNADRKVGFPAASLDWLADDLAAHSDATILLAYHRPFDLPLGHVLGDDETYASRLTNNRFREILAGHPVKYIFTGHIHSYIPYMLGDIPAVVTGGGGDPAQAALGGAKNNLFHYLLVTVEDGRVTTEVRRVQLREPS